MIGERKAAALALLKGLAVAALTTLAGMLALAGLVVAARLSDGALSTLNQVLKALSIAVGAYAAVGAGGRSGLLKGAAVGGLYMLTGYALVSLLGGRVAAYIVGEFAMGALIGAVAGTFAAQLPEPKGRSRGRRRATA